MTDPRTHRRFGALAGAALIAFAFGIVPALAIGTDDPPAPAPSGDGGKKPKPKKSEQDFRAGYRYAYDLIQKGEYRAGIAAMHALGHDEHLDVANYIGYSYRKLGDYADSKIWYEKALAADPRHVRTWSYYGMWQMEQGNRLKALDDLRTIKLICGNDTCKEYKMLKDVIDGKASY